MRIQSRGSIVWVVLLVLLNSVSSKPKDMEEAGNKTAEEPEELTEPEPTKKPDDHKKDDGTTRIPVIAVGVNTGDKLERWGQAVKEAVKKPSEIVKDSVDIFKDGVKMGTEFGEATVSKGIAHLGKQGVATATDLGKIGLDMGTTLANNTLGVIHKIGDMMPIGGRLVKGGVSIGRKGLTAAKTLGENILDNILWWAENGFSWLSNSAANSRSFFHNKTDDIASSIQEGIDNSAGRIGDILSAGIKKLPIFKVNASLTLG